jgi:hypothetical protein
MYRDEMITVTIPLSRQGDGPKIRFRRRKAKSTASEGASHPKVKEAVTFAKHEASGINYQGLQRHHISHAMTGHRNVLRGTKDSWVKL